MRILITALILFASSVLFSQTISIPLARAIHESEPGEQIIFYVKGNNTQIIAEVEKRGGEYRHIFHGYVSIALESSEIEAFIKLECVKQLSFQYHRPVLLSDSMRAKSNVVPVYNGEAPLPNPYRGKDVVIGIIDTGIDFSNLTSDYIFDGEYITKDKDNEDIKLYKIFDVYYAGNLKDKYVHKLPFHATVNHKPCRYNIMKTFKTDILDNITDNTIEVDIKKYDFGRFKSNHSPDDDKYLTVCAYM